ncbi:MAG: hypothetical protein AAGA66_01875 [Bacteroidota bacterium]
MILKLVDFGLVVLIWMTQLIVYPGFNYYSEAQLIEWHVKYTKAISIIVMPLMLGQVLLHGWGLLNDFSMIRLFIALLIALAWVNTFFFAVPLHSKIAAGTDVMDSAASLVRVNWYRTFLWSAVFVLSLFKSLKSQDLFY